MKSLGTDDYDPDDCPDDPDCPDDDFASRGKRARSPNQDRNGGTILNPGSARATTMAMLSQRDRFK
jgi:hypothetical protein